MSQNDTTPTASQKRAANPDFVKTFSLAALKAQLPFSFPVPKETPLPPKSGIAPPTTTRVTTTWPTPSP